MSRRRKILAWIAGSFSLLIVLVLVAGIAVIRTAWFANYVRGKIISITEESTGGRAELATFAFDWRHLHARATGFVLHGTEPSTAAPLLRIDVVDLRLKLLPSFKKTVDLEYLGLEKPAANVIVFPDGTTNVPQPKVPSKSNKSALETIVDLAIRRFDLNQGSVMFADQKIPLAAHGRDLRAQLLFNTVSSTYKGDVSFATVQLFQPGRPPIEASVKLPVSIAKDRVDLNNATISTAASSLTITGSLANLQHPVVEAHAVAHVSLAEIHRATGIAPGACQKGRPCFADADIQAHVDEQKFALSKAAVTMGASRLNASGDRQSVYLEASLAMKEIGAVFDFPGDSIGDVQLEGRVKSEPDRIDVQAMHIEALGGHGTVDGSIANYKTFQLKGTIGGFQLADLERRFLSKPGYDGALAAAVDASGDLSAPGTSGIRARANIYIVPAAHGVPLKGRIDADFDGATKNIKIARASIALPHSLLTLNGTLGIRLNADFSSTDTADLYPGIVMAMKSPPPQTPLTLSGGKLQLHARADGPLASPSIAAQLTADRFIYEKRAFDHLNADVAASAKGASVSNGSLTRGTLVASFSGSVGLRNWTLSNDQPLQASARLHNAELPDLLALAGESAIPATGKLEASVDASGTVGNPLGNISATAKDGSVYGETYQTLDLQASMTDRLIRLTRADWIGPAGAIQATGTYTHSRDTLLAGDVQLHAASNQVRLNAVTNLTKPHAGLDGTMQLNLDAAGSVHPVKDQTQFLLTNLRGDIRADNIHDEKKNFGNLSAHADTSGSNVIFRADSNLSGSSIHLTGQTALARDYPTSADLSVQNLVIENLPVDLPIPAKGTVGITAHAQGTLENPTATAQLTLLKGSLDDEPIDKLQASARYTPQLVEIPSLEITAPAGTATLNGSFAHPSNEFTSGTMQVHVASGDLRLDRIHTLQTARPGFTGALKLTADLAGDLKTIKGEREITPSRVDATASVTGLNYNGHPAGAAKLTAKTTGGAVTFALDSDIAHASIHAQGDMKLTADYPVTAQLSAHEIRYSNLKPFLNVESITQDFDAVADLDGTISGSAKNPDQLKGDLKISRLEASARPRGHSAQSVSLALHNEGPIEAQLDRSVLTIRSAHVTGARGTDIAVTGTVGFAGKTPLNLTVKANADLGLLQDIDRDFYSSGAVSLDASLRGSFSAPQATGSVQLKNASVNMAGFSNGISNANGTIVLNGSNATIRNLTGESGGGKITVTGFAAFASNPMRYSLRVNANRVRTRQQGVSIVNNAALTLSGTTEQGVISGTVTVVSVGINPQSDLGSILTATAADQAASEQVSPFSLIPASTCASAPRPMCVSNPPWRRSCKPKRT